MTDDELVDAVMNPDYRPPSFSEAVANAYRDRLTYADLIAARDALLGPTALPVWPLGVPESGPIFNEGDLVLVDRADGTIETYEITEGDPVNPLWVNPYAPHPIRARSLTPDEVAAYGDAPTVTEGD